MQKIPSLHCDFPPFTLTITPRPVPTGPARKPVPSCLSAPLERRKATRTRRSFLFSGLSSPKALSAEASQLCHDCCGFLWPRSSRIGGVGRDPRRPWSPTPCQSRTAQPSAGHRGAHPGRSLSLSTPELDSSAPRQAADQFFNLLLKILSAPYTSALLKLIESAVRSPERQVGQKVPAGLTQCPSP